MAQNFEGVCVILAAGQSVRMGFAKLTYPLGDGTTLLQRALRACATYPMLVVASLELAQNAEFGEATVILNHEPQRGMSGSLKLADALAPVNASLIVVPADLPLLDADLIDAVARASADVDIAYPVRDGTPGHPVIFSPSARRGIRSLQDGDTLRELRDAPGLSRRLVPIADDRPYWDVDYPDELPGR